MVVDPMPVVNVTPEPGYICPCTVTLATFTETMLVVPAPNTVKWALLKPKFVVGLDAFVT